MKYFVSFVLGIALLAGLALAPSLIKPSQIAWNSSYRSVTDAEKTTWNGKQSPLGYLPLNPTSNLSDVVSASTARTNLGEGSISTQSASAVAITGGTLSGITSIGTGSITTTGNATVGGVLTGASSLSLGNATATASTTPLNLHMGSTYSSVAGANPKLILFPGFGFGVSAGSLDVIGTAGSAQNIYSGSTLSATVAPNFLGLGTATAINSARLIVGSTTQGVIFSKMTTTQRDAITSPTEGTLIYNLTTHQYEVHNGTAWERQ